VSGSTERLRVVLVHGAVERGVSFSKVVPLLPEFDVVTYDRRGHGERWCEGPASLQGDVEDLERILGDRSACVVGHSLGGLVALGAAIRSPQLFESIGLYETAIPWGEWWTDDERSAMVAEVERNVHASGRETVVDAERIQVAWESCQREVEEAVAGPFPWQDLSVPLTTGRGSMSEGNSARDAGLVADYFDAEEVVLHGGDHRIHRSNPSAFAAFVRMCATRRRDVAT